MDPDQLEMMKNVDIMVKEAIKFSSKKMSYEEITKELNKIKMEAGESECYISNLEKKLNDEGINF